MKKIFLLLLLAQLKFSTDAQTDSLTTDEEGEAGMFAQTLVGPRLIAARHEFNDNNMRGALLLYREILLTEPDNAAALYGSAQCYYSLKKYKLALESTQRAISIDPEISTNSSYFIGQIHQRTGKLNEAIEYFEKFLSHKKASTEDKQDAQIYINQCKYALEQMKSPVPVIIQNLGALVNSRYDEYTPSITADGKKLYFTARRNDTKGGKMDENGDYKYFEDIYYSEWNETTGAWSQATQVEGELNTETYDAVLSISPSGNGMFVYKNNVNNAGDIFYSEYRPATNEWSAAEKLPRPINTSYFEGSASITSDGQTLYFVSEQPEGLGQGDIYVAHKSGDKWGAPESMSESINTELDEKFVFIHPNGKTLYFASNGHQTLGGYDIFKSELINGEWSLPINLGYPINTVNEESTFSLTKDNRTMYIAAEYDDSQGERDIYSIDVSQYAVVSRGHEIRTCALIKIRCTENGSEELKNVKVEARLTSTGKVIAERQTNSDGWAFFAIPGNQDYTISAEYDGETMSKNIRPKLNEQQEVTIEEMFNFRSK
jgi:tetratricopeptide (TPR) repeat protein